MKVRRLMQDQPSHVVRSNNLSGPARKKRTPLIFRRL